MIRVEGNNLLVTGGELRCWPSFGAGLSRERPKPASDPHAMPLNDFFAGVVTGLRTLPEQIDIGRVPVDSLCRAKANDQAATFETLNVAMGRKANTLTSAS